ncbi:MAG: hypothetical protein ABFS56_30910 [Pseudomonadota bacterium]
MRQFCSYGPVNCKAHFCVPRKALIAKGVQHLIGSPEEESGHYFTIWAPRQTGKTWLMIQLEQAISQQYPEEFTIFNFSLGALRGMSFTSENSEFPENFGELLEECLPGKPFVNSWKNFRQLFSKNEGLWDRPLILLIDEVDTLPLALIDLMVAQFRELYLNRKNNWLHGLALIGVRAVLGIESQRGSPFNIQRSLKVPNLTPEEVKDLYRQYQEESNQPIEAAVVDKIYESTKGQPGLVSWFGELLTEKYNPGTNQVIDMETWEELWEKARFIEPNNTVMNLIAKVQVPEYQHFLIKLFTNNQVPFSFHRPLCSYLYLHGIIKPVSIRQPNGKQKEICRFSSPFIQDCLYYALTDEIVGEGFETPILPLQPLDDLADVFAGTAGNLLNLPALLTRYKDYLARLKAQGINPWKEQPRRKTDFKLKEAVGHFHMFNWLRDTVGRRCVVSPEFPTGNGTVDLHLQCGKQRGIIEVKSFVDSYQIKYDKEQAADYAKNLGMDSVTIALFIPVLEETVLEKLSTTEVINRIEVNTVAIGWV